MDRAYSLLTIKSVDDDKRIIEGIATTPTPDRVGDVVEPMGAKFALPLPLLWQHQSDNPVGFVETAKRTKEGIPFKARIVKIEEPGPLKDTVDKAWQAVKAGLVRGVSIGFKAIERSFLDGGGIKFSSWEWLELSLVTIPMNSEATISAVKSFDAESLAASGKKNGSAGVRVLPGVSGNLNRNPPKEATMKTISEQIKEWEATLAAKSAKMEDIMNKSAETGETLDADQEQEYDDLKAEVVKIGKHLDRLRDMEKVMKTKAKPVNGADPEEAGESRDSRPRVQVIEPKLEKGIGFARYAMCLVAANGNPVIARELAQQHYPNYKPLHDILRLPMSKGGVSLKTVRDLDLVRRAAVAAGTTSHSDHHSALVNYQDLAGEFVEFLRPRTIIGQFGTGNIPSLRRVPFNIRVPRQTSKATGYWVGEGKPKPVTSFNTEQITLDFFKAATIAVLTDELIRFSSPSAEAIVRDELAAAVIEVIDVAFIDPSNSGSASVKPASITNGVFTTASGGDAASNVRTDVQALFAEIIQANMPLSQAVWIMNANVALALSMMMNDLGQPEFPSITMNGGTFVGLPVLVSQYVPEAVVVLAVANEIYLADDGNVSIAVSNEASIEMLDSSLQQDATAGTGASLVSMFQTNSVAIRAEREINWRTRRTGAVSYLTSVNWGGTAGSGDV